MCDKNDAADFVPSEVELDCFVYLIPIEHDLVTEAALAIYALGIEAGRAAMLRDVLSILRAEASFHNAFNRTEIAGKFATAATDIEDRFAPREER